MSNWKPADAVSHTYAYFYEKHCPEELKQAILFEFYDGLELKEMEKSYEEIYASTTGLIDTYNNWATTGSNATSNQTTLSDDPLQF